MKPFLRKTLGVLLGAAIVIQFVPVDRSNPPVVADFDGPENVEAILRRSCYDCHSNEVSWPWYSRLAPVSWLVARDVKKGREELNFSDWPRFAAKSDMRDEIVEEIDEGEMPLPIYLITHRDANVTAEERAILEAWALARLGGGEAIPAP